MAATTKAELERKFGVPVYVRWHLVPANLHTRTWYTERGIKIPRTASPDAVKGGGQMGGKPRYSFLFSESKWLPKESL